MEQSLLRDVSDRSAYRILLPHPIRYSDTDRQGHVSNAVFAVFFEVGRMEFFSQIEPDLFPDHAEAVVARVEIDYRRELHYPGTIETAIAVEEIGRTSVRLAQAVFRDHVCVASGISVVVQLDSATRKSLPWTDAQRVILERNRLRA